MMLLFPKLYIRDGLCVYPESANSGILHDDPAEMARMLRVMNVKSILLVNSSLGSREPAASQQADWNLPDSIAAVVDDDAFWDTVARVATNVDIPIQLEAGPINASFVARALESGVYRCVAPVGTSAEAATACSLISEFGAQRLTVRFPEALCLGDCGSEDEQITNLVRTLAKSACSRVILSLVESRSWKNDDNLTRRLKAIADANPSRRLRITIDGGVTNADDLLELNKMAPVIVDSVAIHEPFFAARFPCQAFWCWSDKGSMDLSKVSTAELK